MSGFRQTLAAVLIALLCVWPALAGASVGHQDPCQMAGMQDHAAPVSKALVALCKAACQIAPASLAPGLADTIARPADRIETERAAWNHPSIPLPPESPPPRA